MTKLLRSVKLLVAILAGLALVTPAVAQGLQILLACSGCHGSPMVQMGA